MPLYYEQPDTGPPDHPVIVSGSIACELDWVMHAAWEPSFRRDHATLESVYSDAPELAGRVRSFFDQFGGTECSGSLVTIVLAHHGGILFSLDAEELLGRMEELGATAPVDLRLGSETEGDRAAILSQLASLRSSPAARTGFADLVRDVWAAVDSEWKRHGRRSVEAAVAARRDLQHRGASWREVAHNNRQPSSRTRDDLVAALPSGGRIAVVPAYFAHLGSLIELPGVLMIGVRAEGSGAEARVRTELLARRLKTISDPTRLAMLEVLRSTPSTVTELADLFSLAQPTVSNHVKVLRDAGIVASGAQGGHRPLVLQRQVLEDLIQHLEGILGEAEPQPSPQDAPGT